MYWLNRLLKCMRVYYTSNRMNLTRGWTCSCFGSQLRHQRLSHQHRMSRLDCCSRCSTDEGHFNPSFFSFVGYCSECSATEMGQFPICKLRWDLLRTSVTAGSIHKNTFSASFGIFYLKTQIWKQIFQKNPIQPANGVLPICKLLFLKLGLP